MTTAPHAELICVTGELHKWVYRGKDAQSYRCSVCGVVMEKRRLKELTDA